MTKKTTTKPRKQVSIPEDSVQVIKDIQIKLTQELLGVPVTEAQALAWALKKVRDSL